MQDDLILFGEFFAVGLIVLAWFTIWCLKTMPMPETAKCLGRCRLPFMDPRYWSSTTASCSECGSKWRIEMDPTLDKALWRYWVPKKEHQFVFEMPSLADMPLRAFVEEHLEGRPHGAPAPTA